MLTRIKLTDVSPLGTVSVLTQTYELVDVTQRVPYIEIVEEKEAVIDKEVTVQEERITENHREALIPGQFERARELLPDDLYAEIEGLWTAEAIAQYKASLPEAEEPGKEELAANIRAQRDFLIAKTDWTQLQDSPLPADKQAQYKAYRQALRDVPQQEEFPGEVNWPVRPDMGG